MKIRIEGGSLNRKQIEWDDDKVEFLKVDDEVIMENEIYQFKKDKDNIFYLKMRDQ